MVRPPTTATGTQSKGADFPTGGWYDGGLGLRGGGFSGRLLKSTWPKTETRASSVATKTRRVAIVRQRLARGGGVQCPPR